MGAAKRTVKRVNKSQPSEILKQKQKNTVKALLAEKKRQEQMRREFEAFLVAQAVSNNNNNWYFSGQERRLRNKTRKLRH
jgi:hypothetical protein